MVGRAPRQLWLMLAKDFRLMGASPVWTLFEVFIPLLCGIILVFAARPEHGLERGLSALPIFTLHGGYQDVPQPHDTWKNYVDDQGFTRSRKLPADNNQTFTIGYVGKGADIVGIIQNIEKRFLFQNTTRNIALHTVQLESQQELTEWLESTEGVVGGIVFEHVDVSKKELNYRLFALFGETPSIWNNEEPHRIHNANKESPVFPEFPSYWDCKLLSMQYALESTLIELATREGSAPLNLQRMPVPNYSKTDPLSRFHVHILWGVLLLPSVLHTATENVNQVESGMKQFLSVMGLSRAVFCASHMIIGCLKTFTVACLFSLLLPILIQNTPPLILTVTVCLHALSAVIFATLFASFFNRGKTASKMCVLVWFMLCALPSLASPVRTQPLLCYLASLNINHALYYAIQAIDNQIFYDFTFDNIFENSGNVFSLGAAINMIVADMVWMICVIAIVEYMKTKESIIPTFLKRRPVHDINSNKSAATVETPKTTENEVADITISGLYKMWHSGEYAVNGLDLKVYRGGITVLLGHNGAGKSTTFSMICGETTPTQGSISICGHDLASELLACQEKIGLCPQANALFDRLSVWEHLKFFYRLKGANKGDMVKECNDIMEKVNLVDEKNTKAGNLSGGMKRKLCMGMALIGGSQVVLLDEPTAGMDPAARRDVESMLAKEKIDKTILLTTHYMDEAEILGDRVAIMSHGQLKTYGTIDELKKKFGSGYLLNMVASEEIDTVTCAEKMMGVITQQIPSATIDWRNVHGKQFEIMLPQTEIEKFPDLLKYLEDNAVHLNISSFGLSLNSLEQIFLKVDSAENNNNDSSSREQAVLSKADMLTGFPLLLSQLRALFAKKFYYNRRNLMQFFMQFIIPILILLFFALGSLVETHDKDWVYNLDSLGDVRIAVHGKSEWQGKVSAALRKHDRTEMIPIDSSNVNERLKDLRKALPAIPFAYRFSSNQTTYYYTFNAVHSLPIALNVLSNAKLGSGYIRMTASSFAVNARKYTMIGWTLIPLTHFLFSMIISTYVVFLVEERTSRYKHQQLLCGVHPGLMWIASALFDFLLCLPSLFSFVGIFIYREWIFPYHSEMAVLCVLYILSMLPFVYLASCFCKTSTKNFTIVYFWMLVGAVCGYAGCESASQKHDVMDRPKTFRDTATYAMLLAPSFAYVEFVRRIFDQAWLRQNELFNLDIWAMINLGSPTVVMSVNMTYTTFVLILFMFKKVRRRVLLFLINLWHGEFDIARHKNPHLVDDVDVCEEITRVDSQTTSKTQNNQSANGADKVSENEKDVLRISHCFYVNHLAQRYGKFVAVSDMSFGVKPKECFGLLGTNGAGKTSIFSVVTGELYASRGSVTINEVDVKDYVSIGYCPQFDALMLDLTGWENLIVLARMRGFANPIEHVQNALKLVGMEKHAGKPMRNCSGGQRRRISIAAAILAQSDLVILDEPTAGVDPKARRDIWDTLSSIRSSGSAVLLTSHSMAECEALCSRIAILNKGNMIAIGSAQHLKSRFGKNYSLSISLPSAVVDREAMKNEICAAIENEFGSEHVISLASSISQLKWKISRVACDRWSVMFSRMLAVRTRVGFEDFCLTQASLEDTFMCLAQHNNHNHTTA